MTFEQIGKVVGKDEVWVAALMYGQVQSQPLLCSTPLIFIPLTGQGYG